jgi:hypothetical protein
VPGVYHRLPNHWNHQTSGIAQWQAIEADRAITLLECLQFSLSGDREGVSEKPYFGAIQSRKP